MNGNKEIPKGKEFDVNEIEGKMENKRKKNEKAVHLLVELKMENRQWYRMKRNYHRKIRKPDSV